MDVTASVWGEWFDSWRLALEVKGRREQTIAFYERELHRFAEHANIIPQHVTREMVRRWIKSQLDAGLAPNTINGRLIVVKSFYSWLVAEGEMGYSPAAGLSSPPHRGPDPAVLSDDEFDRLLAVVPKSSNDPLVRRNRAIILVLESSGCRSRELVSMRDDGVDLRERSLLVEGKGGAFRSVPVSAEAAEAVDRYRRARGQLRGGGTGKLWWGRHGDLTPKGLATVLKRLGDEAGVHLHAHRLRHRFAHRWLDAGGSEAGLQTAAGWTSVVMPRRYGRALSQERMLGEHKRLFDKR